MENGFRTNKRLLWIPHVGLDIPGYRSTQLGCANALEKYGWSVHFLAKVYINGVCDDPDLKSSIIWINRRSPSWLMEIDMVKRLNSLIRELRPHIVMIEPMGFRYILPILLIQFTYPFRPIWVLDIRTPPLGCLNIKNMLFWLVWLIGVVGARFYAHGVTVISKALEHFIRFLIGKKIPCAIWSSGVDTNRFDPDKVKPVDLPIRSDKHIVFLYHGSIVARSGVDRGILEMIHAFANIRNKFDNTWLIVLGGSEEDRQWISHHYLQVSSNNGLLLFPPVENSKVPEYLAAADVGVCPLPNLWQWSVSSPLKIFEYLAMGKTVLATDIEAHRIILNNFPHSILVREATAECLAAGMEQAILNIDKLRHHSKLYRQYILTSSGWDTIARSLSSFFNHINPHIS
jgi:glycosyltransferase involved in cell wall biosynthesis